MKKQLSWILVLALPLLLQGCEPQIEEEKTPAISVAPETVSMYVWDSVTLQAALSPADAVVGDISWVSSDTTIASVDAAGVVSAWAEGSVTITANAEGATTGKCEVQVLAIPETFPRKFLIEHFTGDECGFCPESMNVMVAHIDSATVPYIWVSHHYGYADDEYTIRESKQIGKMLNVPGAPRMLLNRTEQQPGMVFVPNGLPNMTITDAETADVSVKIARSYQPDTRELNLTVSGLVGHKMDTSYLLTVIIKENRLVGRQADYKYTWKNYAWKEYMHSRVARAVLSEEYFGDTVKVEKQRYSRTYSYVLDEEWVAENCCVVAYLSATSKKPIINAEQVPVVEGTTGGEEYKPYGITEGKGPNSSISFDSIQVRRANEDQLEVALFASKSLRSATFGVVKAVGLVYINTKATSLEAGSYTIQADNATGSITAGYHIDEQACHGGSRLLYALSPKLKEGEIVAAHTWCMLSGEMVVEADGKITLNFKTPDGASITSTYTTEVEEE